MPANRIDALQDDGSGLDLDLLTDDVLEMPVRPPAALDFDMIDAVLRRADVMPRGIGAREFSEREYGYLAPGMRAELRVTTDSEYFEEHPENLELWSPGSPRVSVRRGFSDRGQESGGLAPGRAGITLV